MPFVPLQKTACLTLLFLQLAASPAQAQQQAPGSSVAGGSACSGSSYIWPDANGDAVQCVSSVYVLANHATNDGSGTSIDWSLGSTHYTTASCGAFTFTNMADGGSYQLMVEGTTTGTCSFSQSGLTFKMPSNHGATTSSKMTVYSFTRVGTNVFVTWLPGY